MLEVSSKLVEFSVVRFTLESDLDFKHARWLRGAIGAQIDLPEFHHHTDKGLVYQHPLVRYTVCGKQAIMLGLAGGAFLLRGVPAFETLRLGSANYRVLDQTTQATRVDLGPCAERVIYHFQTPYLALNQQNHVVWQESDLSGRRRLLERVVVGNLLSLSKAVGLNVAKRLRAEVELVPDDWHELKPGLRLLGFRGAVQVNFLLPDGWGIGKSSSRGFGTLIQEGK